MTHLAAELGLSDVGLSKTCRRHEIPTPPVGWWAKKAHGKATPITPLPGTRPAGELVSFHGYTAEGGKLAAARAAAKARLQQAVPGDASPHPVVERTIARLEKAKTGKDGLKRVSGPGLITVVARPSSEERAGQLLRSLAEAAALAELQLAKTEEGAAFRCDGEIVSLELVEAPDQVEHVATEKELAAVAKWKREREETHRRFGYWSNYGEPHVPKWDEQYNGRLAIRLEKVRARGEDDWRGRVITRTFADSRTRDVLKTVPRMIEAVAAIAAAKKSNRVLDERRRAAAEEQARRWAEAERLRQREEMRCKALDQLVAERAELDRLARLLAVLRGGAEYDVPPRVRRLLEWAANKLAAGEEQLTPVTLEKRLAVRGLFDEEE